MNTRSRETTDTPNSAMNTRPLTTSNVRPMKTSSVKSPSATSASTAHTERPSRPWRVPRQFPVRVRIPVAAHGFGQQLDAMHRWLHRRVGLSRFYQFGEHGPVGDDRLVLYLDDLEVAREFVARFDSALLVGASRAP